MLAEVINNPDLDKYLICFDTGQTIFLEGEDSQDLYILVSGQLGILKGKKRITEVTEAGSVFGEMSFFLRAERTATVKAENEVKTIRIPKEEVTGFLLEFPAVAEEITKLLAKRLDQSSQIVYGLKEFSDQLPDAVILSDREGKILTWNTAAEKLFGWELDQIRNKSMEDIYEDPQEYRGFLEEVQSSYSVNEKIHKIRHPEKGPRFISTSATVLYDGQHNFQGVISLGRDVTAIKKLERKYRRARIWLVPSLILLGLLGAAVFYGFPYFSKGYQTKDVNKQKLRNDLAKDYLLLQSLLAGHFATGDKSKTTQLTNEFFDVQENTAIPYTGLILLNKDKKVFNAYSIRPGIDAEIMVGHSYAGIEFQGSDDSIHSVLSLYHVDKDHPMGQKSLEIAFEVKKDNQPLGWLIFQMDIDFIEREYGVDEEGLKAFRFKKP